MTNPEVQFNPEDQIGLSNDDHQMIEQEPLDGLPVLAIVIPKLRELDILTIDTIKALRLTCKLPRRI